MATTPVQLYTSAGMPIGGFGAIAMYRIAPSSVTVNGVSYSISTAPASGSLSGSTSLGTFIFEKLSLSLGGNLIERMDAMGTTSDKTLLRKDPRLTATIQAAGVGTKTLCPGDAFEDFIGYGSSSTTGSPVLNVLSRWFIVDDGINFDAANPTIFTATFALDRQNSSSSLVIF